MDLRLENQIFARFKFFHPRRPVTEGRMCFGFECDNGWFQLIWDLCTRIEELHPPHDFEVLQVKEKFGGLRFYTSASSKKIMQCIHAAGRDSFHVCELCGHKGSLRQRGLWLKTLCNECQIAEGYSDYVAQDW